MDCFEINDVSKLKGIKLVHLNVRSLYNKMDQIRDSFVSMDVILISETWLVPSIPDSALKIPGYNFIRQDRNHPDGKRGGGLCIYVKSIYKIDFLEDCFNKVTEDFELIGIAIKHPNIKPFNVVGIYRPPSGKQHVFIKYLNDNLPNLISDRRETFLLGDFNINYATDETRNKHKLRTFELKFNLVQLIKSPTRTTTSTQTIIDWIYTDSANISQSGTLNINMSDHLPVFLVRKKSRTKIERHKTSGRSYIRYNKDIFNQLLDQQDWTVFDNSDEVDQMWSEIEMKITNSLDKICPVRELLVSDSKPEWLNNEIIQVMRNRDKAYRRARRSENEVDWRKATFLRNRVEILIKTFKQNKIKDNINRHRNNPAKFWKEIRTILPYESSPIVTSLDDEETGITYSSHELSDHINHYFATIGEKLAITIKNRQDLNTTYHPYQSVYNHKKDVITDTPFTPAELHKAMKLINISKSSAVKNIRASVILDAHEILFDRILRLYNQTLVNAKFPTAWKTSIVVPVPKINTPKYASDFRPISLIPTPGKILEHLISFRLKDLMSANNILTPNQHGFRKDHSTITSVTSLLNSIYNNVNTYKDTYLIYLDLKKAFDTVSHTILINKLGNFGLDLRTVSWFGSYLDNRQQYVKFNNVSSSVLNIKYGVPQGSILGPTLFALYINDLASLFQHENITLYADDTVICNTDPILLQSMLNKTNIWCDVNLLTVNCKKSQWMRTSIVHKHLPERVFRLGTTRLDEVNEYKYLGLILDTNLNFKSQRDNLYRRVNLKQSFFKRIRRYIDISTAATIYKSTILPIIEYADFVYDHNIKYVSNKLQTLQNQALSVVHNQHIISYALRDSTEVLHRNIKMYRLCHRRKLHLLSFAYKLSHNVAFLDQRDIPTRQHAGKMFLILKSEHYRYIQNPVYRAMIEWNSLPVDIRNSNSKAIFLRSLKRIIPNPYMKVV